MKLLVRDTFPGTIHLYWQATNDPDLDAAMAEAGQARREVLSESREGDVEVRVQRFHTNVELPSAVQRALRTNSLTYDQTTRVHQAANRVEWSVIPAVMADRVTAKGEVRISATAQGVERLIDGEVTVRIPLVGGMVERVICDLIERSYHNAAALQRDWMTQRLSQT